MKMVMYKLLIGNDSGQMAMEKLQWGHGNEKRKEHATGK